MTKKAKQQPQELPKAINLDWQDVIGRVEKLTGKRYSEFELNDFDLMTNDEKVAVVKHFVDVKAEAERQEYEKHRGPQPEKFTLAEAFDYFYEPDSIPFTEANFERAIRSVAFLLHWCSSMGNKAVESNAANGLAYVLEQAIKDVPVLNGDVRRERDELRKELGVVRASSEAA